MSRLAVLFCLIASSMLVVGQTPTSDALAVSLAAKSVSALTGGNVITDVTATGNVIWIFGSDYETGTGTFKANTLGQSRADLALSGGMRSDVRTLSNGVPSGAWQMNSGTVNSYSNANCLTDAAWLFPGLSSLTQTSNTTFVFKYIGLEQHGGVSTQHVQIFQASKFALTQHLSTMDIYLDPVTFLPFAISSPVHPDLDASTDIPSEIRFANYQPVNGVLVPFRIQRMLSGGVVTDITVTSVTFNTGLPNSIFSLQ